jgi:hypothetical protein
MKWIPIPEILIVSGLSLLFAALRGVVLGVSTDDVLIEALSGVVCFVVEVELRWSWPWA